MSNGRNRYMVPRVLVTLGTVVLVGWRIFVNTTQADLILQTYLLTALLFGLLLLGKYPPFASGWFWKAMILISALHVAILGIFWKATLETAPLKLQLPTRLIYGFIWVVLLFERWMCLRIIAFFSPKTEY